jgi:sugar lactone lactonase YvrE
MRRTITLFIAASAFAACAKNDKAGDTTAAASDQNGVYSAKAGETGGMKVPESVKYDAELDVFYVSNINGNPSQKDNNGFIARVRADSPSVVTMLVEGGKNGVTLNAPKGMALVGDTLYIADIDNVRKFNRRTGASLGSVSFAAQKATFLNDVAAGPDGIYITDTGIMFDSTGAMTHPGVNRIFKLVGKKITEAATGDSLVNPNGLTWDATRKAFLLAPFGSTNIQTWAPGQANPTTLTTGPGQYDGIELLANGNVLVSSWADSSVYVAHGGTHMVRMVRGVSAPADIGVDTKRNLVAVPRFNDGKVEYYKIQ